MALTPSARLIHARGAFASIFRRFGCQRWKRYAGLFRAGAPTFRTDKCFQHTAQCGIEPVSCTLLQSTGEGGNPPGEVLPEEIAFSLMADSKSFPSRFV